MSELCIQETYAPHNACYGCGPANPRGLHLRSIARGDEVVAAWSPEPHHQAFPGVLNGGIIGTLLDCHCTWTAAYQLMRHTGADKPPCTVTAEYAVALKRPTPTDQPVSLVARVAEFRGDRVIVEATLTSGGKVTATCRGTFVAVKPGHPAYNTW